MGRKPMSDEDEVFLYVQAFCCSPFDLSVTAATWHDVALALNYCMATSGRTAGIRAGAVGYAWLSQRSTTPRASYARGAL